MGFRSIREIFRVGHGPSSSHTMGPAMACDYILNKYKNISFVEVSLFDSLALTGKGHLTDYIIDLKLKNIPHKINFNFDVHRSHPNTMQFLVTLADGSVLDEKIVSIGGGTIVTKDNIDSFTTNDLYEESSLEEILESCEREKLGLVDFILKHEGRDILSYMSNIYDEMEKAKNRGISQRGFLPGKLGLVRKAPLMFQEMLSKPGSEHDIHLNMAITAYAVSEENASGGIVVIAPTCGSCGVIPACITYLLKKDYSKSQIIRGLLVAGLIGIICKTNASISGAEAGCQAEIGVACAMGAAMISAVKGFSNSDIAQSAEIAIEHSLGLTCDPVDGYVQIPCIERNAVFAIKATTASNLAKVIPASSAKVSFDTSLKAMYQTGKDLNKGYRETSTEGLAKLVK